MRTLIALSGAAALFVLAGCDPTQRFDYQCIESYQAQQICIQFRLVELDAVAARQACLDHSGSWAQDPCPTTNRTAGYCKIEASQYSISGTDPHLYFYGVDRGVAETACTSGDFNGQWQQ